jgi:hypothetical protein
MNGYMLIVSKDDRNIPTIIRDIRKILFALEEYEGDLTIEVTIHDEV